MSLFYYRDNIISSGCDDNKDFKCFTFLHTNNGVVFLKVSINVMIALGFDAILAFL